MVKTYIISLRDRKDKRDKLALDFPHTFLLQERAAPKWGIGWVRGDTGCALGHRQAVELAFIRDLPAVLVLEDDAVPVDPDYVPTLEDATHPVTFLGGEPLPESVYDVEAGTVVGVVGTHAVLYRADAYRDILEGVPGFFERVRHRSQLPVDVPYDHWLSRRGVGFKNRFVQNFSLGSDIREGAATKGTLGNGKIEEILNKQLQP